MVTGTNAEAAQRLHVLRQFKPSKRIRNPIYFAYFLLYSDCVLIFIIHLAKPFKRLHFLLSCASWFWFSLQLCQPSSPMPFHKLQLSSAPWAIQMTNPALSNTYPLEITSMQMQRAQDQDAGLPRTKWTPTESTLDPS